MSKEILKQRLTLTNDEISSLVAKIRSLAGKYSEREQLNLALTLEEVLLDYQLAFGKDKTVYCVWREDFFRGSRITISSPGQECNPLLMANEEDAEVIEYAQRMMNVLGLGTQFQYLRG